MPVPNILFGLNLILNGESWFSKKKWKKISADLRNWFRLARGKPISPKVVRERDYNWAFRCHHLSMSFPPGQSAPAKHIIFAWQKLSIPFSRSLTQRVFHNYAVTMRVRASERAGYSPAALHKLADRPSFLPPSADATQQQSNIWSKCQTADASCSAS